MSPTRIRPTPDRPPKPSPPPPSPPAVPPSPPPTWSIGSFGNASIDHWDASFLAAVAAVKAKKGVAVNPRVMKAMMAVESGNDGNYPPDRCRSDGSCGPMQVKFPIHSWRCPDCNTKTVPGQIELATHIIADTMKANGVDEYGAITSVYFPTDDVQNGTTQAQYIAKVRSLVATMSGMTPAPSPPPPVDVDPIRVIVGGDYPPITYGFLSDVGINSYAYVVGHGGTRSTQHSGDDVPVPHGTKLYTPLPGTVTCVGNAGTVIWGEGCGAFHDDMYGGIGNITILFDGMDLKMTLGHCHTCVVKLGQHVSAGQQVGTSGGSNGDHVHVDIATLKNGSYWLLDPIPTLRTAMGGVAPVTYADPVDVPQPDDAPAYIIVRATKTTPVLQRANPAAPPIFEPLNAGTTFHAQHKLIGTDGRWYWVGRLRGRVAEADTEIVEVVTA
jgi:hypothetical protein